MIKDFFTTKAAARVLRIDEKATEKILNHPSEVDAYDLYLLANTIGITVDELLKGEFRRSPAIP